LAAMEMKTLDAGRGEMVFLTHPCKEKSFRDALSDLEKTDAIDVICNSFRVEGNGS